MLGGVYRFKAGCYGLKVIYDLDSWVLRLLRTDMYSGIQPPGNPPKVRRLMAGSDGSPMALASTGDP